MENIIEFNFLEDLVGYHFNDKSLIKDALTHPSTPHQTNSNNYQRLEFLGDSVLNFIVTTNLIDRYPRISEGDLTTKRANIINKKTLSKCAKAIGLNQHMLIGKSIDKVTEKKLCDTYEALIGAIMLDSNIKEVTTFIKKTLLNDIKAYRTKTNYKGKLIEFCRKNKISSPKYKTEKKECLFISEVTLLNDEKTYYEKGGTKKEAENNLSKKILAILEKIKR